MAMMKYQEPEFIEIELDRLLEAVGQVADEGLAFVQICATTKEASCELLYTFQDTTYETKGLKGLLVDVPDGAHVPSITGIYPAAFVFENETHDLFGVQIDGINIDFGGEFYTVAVAYPMNPRAAQSDETAEEEADNE